MFARGYVSVQTAVHGIDGFGVVVGVDVGVGVAADDCVVGAVEGGVGVGVGQSVILGELGNQILEVVRNYLKFFVQE